MSQPETNAQAAGPAANARVGKVRVAAIVGPTGAGKSRLALRMAERIGGEIVNCDSRLFYRGLDIGTAKPTADERRRLPHHLIDIRSPDNPLDVAVYGRLARAAIREIAERGRPPIIVGGSGLYLRALLDGIFAGPAASPELRARLRQTAALEGSAALHGRLRELDPEAANRIAPGDLKRIVRALEVFEVTGRPLSVHHAEHRLAEPSFEALKLGLAPPRAVLYAAIERRFGAMLAAGLVEEVRRLLAVGPSSNAPVFDAIGYRQIAAFLRGELGLEDAIALAKRESRRLAKRQLTWFRRDPAIRWLDPEGAEEEALPMLLMFFGARVPGQAAGPQNSGVSL